jgi:hypothetical protein
MSSAVEKILGVAGVVERDELELALGKRHAFGEAPPTVVRAYVEALAARVARRRSARATLTAEENVVLEALERAGGRTSLPELREATAGRLALDALARVLRTSPLFLRESRAIYRLVGRAAGAFPYRYVTFAGNTTIVAPIQ